MSQAGREWDSWEFYHSAKNSMQFKNDELFISGIFHLIFLDWGSPVIKLPLGTLNAISKCLALTPSSAPKSSSQLMHTPGGSRWKLRYLGLC